MCDEIFRLKERLGCEPSDEQLAASLQITRAELQSKLIECSLAREKLAMSNVRLVMSIAQRYDNMGAEMADLIQVIILYTRALLKTKFWVYMRVPACNLKKILSSRAVWLDYSEELRNLILQRDLKFRLMFIGGFDRWGLPYIYIWLSKFLFFV